MDGDAPPSKPLEGTESGLGLSPTAHKVLGALPSDGSSRGNNSLRDDLRLEEEPYARAIAELQAAGLIRKGPGPGGSVRRAVESRPLPPIAQKVLDRMPIDGSMIGNLRLRSLVALDNEEYVRAIQVLKDSGLIRVGRGRGGSVGRVSEVPQAPTPLDKPSAEKCLYKPFAAWVRSGWTADETEFAQVKVTATGLHFPKGVGKWSVPDITAVQVWLSEWLPSVIVEVSSYEIKKRGDGTKLESIYEAAAHGRWAHRASLVIEEESESLDDRFHDEIKRFGLGLYLVRRRANGQLDVREYVEPQLQNPDPSQVDDLLSYFFEEDPQQRKLYKAAIGRL